jgi:hypothetical protein
MSETAFPTSDTPRRKPALITATGVITIVFCALNLIFLLYGIISSLVVGGPQHLMEQYRGLYSYNSSAQGLYDQMLNMTSQYYPFILIMNLATLAVTVAGLAGGILLLQAKRPGRPLLRGYAVAELVVLAASTVWTVVYVGALKGAMNGYFAAAGLSGAAEGVANGIITFAMYFGVVFGVVIGASWPILVLAFMNARSVKNYFSTAA